jgi:hypothetical protein
VVIGLFQLKFETSRAVCELAPGLNLLVTSGVGVVWGGTNILFIGEWGVLQGEFLCTAIVQTCFMLHDASNPRIYKFISHPLKMAGTSP